MTCTYDFKGPDGKPVRITGKADFKAYLASGGLQFLLPARAAAFLREGVTSTPEFKDWFGKSVVVDGKGKPKVMYHGTAQDISTFKGKQAGAIFVTDDPKFAEDFAVRSEFWMLKNAAKEGEPQSSQNIMPVFVKAENPFDYTKSDHIDGLKKYEEANRYSDKAIPIGHIEQVQRGAWEFIEDPRVQAAIKSLGHDGFYAKEDGRKNLAVYSPAQIKSATGNNGAFDANNPDIRFRKTAIQEAISPRSRQQTEMVERLANGMAAKLANPPEIVVFSSLQDGIIPQSVRDEDARQREGGATGTPEGFYYKGKAYIWDGLKRPEDVARVFAHEVLGHYGLRGLYGQALTPVLEQIVALRKADVLAKAKEYGLDTKDPAALLKAAEEVLAEMAQAKPDIGFVKRAVAAIRAWLRQNVPGFASMEFSDAEIIQNFLLPARAFVEQGAQAGRDMATVSFSRASKPAPTGLTPPEQGLLRRIQAAVQDNKNRVRQVQERIQEVTGKPVSERSNYYGAESQRPGRIAARLEDAKAKLTGPLMEKLAKSGHTAEQLGELLHAMHAQERNEAVARINPDMPDGGSGMTTDQANAILAKNRTNRVLHELANDARAIAKQTLSLKHAYGLIDGDTYEALSEAYENYVPLKGDGEFGPKVKRAMGHEEREEHILENIARDYDQAVVVGEKNLARQSLLQMVLENPDKDLWTVGVPPKGRYVAGKVYSILKNGKQVATFTHQTQVMAFLEAKGHDAINYEVKDSNGEQVREFVKPLQDNEVMVYVDGQPVRIQIVGDEQLARQLRPLDQGKMNAILEVMRSVNRYLSKIYTGYNPAFIIRNTARDAMTGTVNMIGNEGAGTAAKAWANYPAALKALSIYAATGKEPSGEAGAYLNEYRQHGGKTGASWMADLEEQGKSLTRMFDDAYGASGYLKDGKAGKAAAVAGRKIVGGMAHVVEVANQATENGLRLSLYMAMRKQGSSPGVAAQAAKSVTVDFDRKGSMTGALGAIFLFFNPAVQGTSNAIKTLAKGAHKEQAWMALGALAALGAYAASQGMDDDEDRWLGEGWESRSSNFMMNIGGHTIKAPLSMEFKPFYAAGIAMTEAKRGESKLKAAGHLISSFIDAYFPLQGAFNSESDNHGADLISAVTPTVLKPWTQLAQNRSSFGSQITPENDFTKDRPDNLKMFKGTKGSVYDAAAQGLAKVGEMTGAGRYENDMTKVSPETLKMLWRTYTGGLGQFVTDMGGLANIGTQAPDSVETADVPIVKDFVKTNDVRAIRGRYYDLTKQAKQTETEYQQAEKAGDGQAMDLIWDIPDKAKLLVVGKIIKKTNEDVASLRDQAVDINADTSLSMSDKRAKLKKLEKDEEALYRDAIRAFK